MVNDIGIIDNIIVAKTPEELGDAYTTVKSVKKEDPGTIINTVPGKIALPNESVNQEAPKRAKRLSGSVYS